jgi:hypothetical protein
MNELLADIRQVTQLNSLAIDRIDVNPDSTISIFLAHDRKIILHCKLATNSDAASNLQHDYDILNFLHHEDAFHELQCLIPTPVCSGIVSDIRYFVESAASGIPAADYLRKFPAKRQVVIKKILSRLTQFMQASLKRITADDALYRQLVESPVKKILRISESDP